jgi:ligand-binding SRPBCC domain-containing protein
MQPSSTISELHFSPSPTGHGIRLTAELWLPRPRPEIFAFFSDAFNLEALTPSTLQFHLLTPSPIQLREGTLIDYRLKLRGIPMRWQSRIDVWKPPELFVDFQTRGPYRLWRHEHCFEEHNGGTLCRDIVDYAVPGGWPIERLLVRPDLQKIFRFRRAMLLERFDRPIASAEPR